MPKYILGHGVMFQVGMSYTEKTAKNPRQAVVKFLSNAIYWNSDISVWRRENWSGTAVTLKRPDWIAVVRNTKLVKMKKVR